MTYNVCTIGTGIFATDAHLPVLKQSKWFTPYSCFNRTKKKAEVYAQKANITKIYDSMDEAFEDPKVDLYDVLLPVQYNLDAVKLAVKNRKNICLEKPIAANLDQAEEIVKIAEKHPEIEIAISEHWCYFKAINAMKDAMTKIGKVYSFTYHSTGQFNFGNKYLATTWRRKPQHIGGYLSDGGVHQLALLTETLGEVSEVNARTRQIRELSGADDMMYTLLKMKSGIIGTFTYGSSFGSAKKDCYFDIMGDNGTIHLDFGPGHPEQITLRVGDLNVNSKSYTKDIVIEDENRTPAREFEVLGESLNESDKSLIVATPRIAFHHLAIIDAALRSSQNDGQTIKVRQP